MKHLVCKRSKVVYVLSCFVIDSELSEAQEEHILAINHHVPELTDLKNELCPSRMTEGCFWTIYFLLIFPRLDKDKGELLSSPQVLYMHGNSQFYTWVLKLYDFLPNWNLTTAIFQKPIMEDSTIFEGFDHGYLGLSKNWVNRHHICVVLYLMILEYFLYHFYFYLSSNIEVKFVTKFGAY